MKHVEKDLFACLIGAVEQSIFENTLYHAAFFDDILSFLRAEQQSLSAIVRSFSAFQISLTHQLVHIDGHQVRLDPADLHDITGSVIFWIVAEEHENIKSCLRQL